MGTEHGLLNHLAALVDARVKRLVTMEPPPIAWIEDGLGGGSPNHMGLRADCWYGDGRNAGDGRAKLLEFFQRQEREGLQTRRGACEILSSTHDQLWCAIAGFSLWEGTRRRDREVIDAATQWWRSYFSLCESMVCTRIGTKGTGVYITVVSPGARAFKKGKALFSNPGRDLCYSVVYGTPLPPGNGPKWAAKQYNLGARCLSLLGPEVCKTLRPTPDESCPMAFPLIVDRFQDGDFLARFEPQLPPKLRGCDAAGVENGEPWVEEHLSRDRAERYAARTPISTIEFPAVA